MASRQAGPWQPIALTQIWALLYTKSISEFALTFNININLIHFLLIASCSCG